MKLYLMRHGETDYNKARCFYGSHDVSINQTGQEQAKSLRQLVKDLSIQAIYTSNLKRSQQTARLVFGDKVFQTRAGFDEKGFGLWEGLTADQIQAQFPEAWEAWLQAPFDVTPPQAEAFSDFQTRVWQTLDELLEDNPFEQIALVAHLGVLRLIYQHLIPDGTVFLGH